MFFCLIHSRLQIRITLHIHRGIVFPRAPKGIDNSHFEYLGRIARHAQNCAQRHAIFFLLAKSLFLYMWFMTSGMPDSGKFRI
jgi:hypothetical protein